MAPWNTEVNIHTNKIQDGKTGENGLKRELKYLIQYKLILI